MPRLAGRRIVASLEKIVVDAELLRNWAEMLKPIAFSDDDLRSAIKTSRWAGTSRRSHTLARYESGSIAAAVRLVELRELERCRRPQCHRAGDRHLEEDARRVPGRPSSPPSRRPSTLRGSQSVSLGYGTRVTEWITNAACTR